MGGFPPRFDEMNRREQGKKAEDVAVGYLVSIGYRILERNVHMRYGEIDIVARDGDEMVFVEVRSSRFHEPSESIDRKKLSNMVRAIRRYILDRNVESPFRIEVIIVVGGRVSRHIRDIFFDSEQGF